MNDNKIKKFIIGVSMFFLHDSLYLERKNIMNLRLFYHNLELQMFIISENFNS